MDRALVASAVAVLTLLVLSLTGCGGGSTEAGVPAPTSAQSGGGPEAGIVETGPEGTATLEYGASTRLWVPDLVFEDPIRGTIVSIGFPNIVQFYSPRPGGGDWTLTCVGWLVQWRGRTISYRAGVGVLNISLNAQPDVDLCSAAGRASWTDRAACIDPRGFE